MLKNISLCIFFAKISAYRRDFDMSLLMKDDELLEAYNKIWEKVRNSIKKEFDSEPVYREKYLETKIKSYTRKINANFQGNKVLKKGSQCICLSVLLIYAVFRTYKNYYPQVFLEEIKYVDNGKKMPENITNEIEISSDD